MTDPDDVSKTAYPPEFMNLLAASADDPGVAFESGNLHLLATLRTTAPADFQRVRAKLKATGSRVGDLDSELDRVFRSIRQPTGPASGQPFAPVTVEAWPEEVDGDAVLNEAVNLIRRHVVLDPAATRACVLYAALTYLMATVRIAPRLVFKSPEKRCGKTTLLKVMTRLVAKPLAAANASPAALYRVITAEGPTLLIDEADTFATGNEELRGIINSGHERDAAFVLRCVGDDHTPHRFSTWAAMVIAGIGNLPGTIEDRAVVVSLRRKLPGEKAEKLRRRHDADFETLAGKLARLALQIAEAVAEAEPEMPAGLNDRAQDNWEPLLAIADAAGGEWPEHARVAALSLSGAEPDVESKGVMLLADIRAVLETGHRADFIGSTALVAALNAMEERPWAECNKGKPLTTHALAGLLKPFKIAPGQIKALNVKGYERGGFDDAFARYLPEATDRSETPKVYNHNNGLDGSMAETERATVSVLDEVKHRKNKRGFGVSDRQGDEPKPWRMRL